MHALLRFSTLALAVALATPAAAQDEEGESEEIEATEVKEAAPPPASTPAETASDDRSPIDGVMGHFGLGYFSGSAPVGMRYWMDRDSALDLGVAINFSSGGVETHRYGLEAGWVMALAHYHYAVVFARFGLGLLFEDSIGDEGGPARWDLDGNLFLGAELFLGAFGFPNVSLQGGYGLQANYTYQGGSAFMIGTVDGGLSVVTAGTVGFHIYL
jgi:hypothetical protein